MNQLPWNWLFLIPVFFFTGAVALLSMLYSWRERWKYRNPYNDHLYRCSVCEHVYVDERETGLARCPRCECLNEHIR